MTFLPNRILYPEAEITRQGGCEPRHERDGQEADQHDEQIRQHRARRTFDIAAHDSTADIEAHAGKWHEAADAHGDDEDERIVHLAETKLASDRYQQGRYDIE